MKKGKYLFKIQFLIYGLNYDIYNFYFSLLFYDMAMAGSVLSEPIGKYSDL